MAAGAALVALAATQFPAEPAAWTAVPTGPVRAAPASPPAALIVAPVPLAQRQDPGPRAVSAVDPEAAPPARVRIPSAGVDSTLVGLRRQRDGTLEVPQDFGAAGWYRAGIKPGDTGPAVLVGHVDSYDGPAVFFRLSELKNGDPVTVSRTDGSEVAFTVYATERVSKSSFPTARVYGDTEGPELRLLTCGGAFDEQTKHYRDNVIVYARQVVPA